jgi:predicted nucleic acid-binding protein
MRVLLDTNIVIHREASRVTIEDIGILFKWLDRLRYEKYLHPITIQEINKLKNKDDLETFNIKLTSYVSLNVPAPLHPNVTKICAPLDKNQNDSNDTLLINEVYNDRVDVLITEDKKIKKKANLLNIADKVFSIDSFLAKVIAEHPDLSDYKTLSVKKEYFGKINLSDQFFDSLKEDYPGFEHWFNKKSQETAYICQSEAGVSAFLYLKVEDEHEPYPEITPVFSRKKRLKVGTFKAALNRHLLGERLVKIIFDNAVRYQVDEIYVTILDKRTEQRWLIKMLEDYGFEHYGHKQNEHSRELVYVRDMKKRFDPNQPKLTYPYISKSSLLG